MSDARFDDSLVYDERDVKRVVSQDCYDDLKRSGLVEQYPCWRTKTKGDMPGVILFGSSAVGQQKVFVKRYPLVAKPNEGILLDYAVFAIMRKCGGRTPDVDIKSSDKHMYLFSTHLSHSQKKHVDRQYWFKIFYRNKFNIDVDRKTLGVKKELFGLGEEFKLDKVEIARTLILGIMFNTFDFHHSNLGMVVSSEGVAKLGLVDFLVRPHKIQIQHDSSIVGFIREIYGTVWTFPQLHQMIASLDDEDCVAAFKKIDTNFHTACDDVAAKIDSMPFKRGANKAELAAAFEIWKSNYEEIKCHIQRSVRSYIHGSNCL